MIRAPTVPSAFQAAGLGRRYPQPAASHLCHSRGQGLGTWPPAARGPSGASGAAWCKRGARLSEAHMVSQLPAAPFFIQPRPLGRAFRAVGRRSAMDTGEFTQGGPGASTVGVCVQGFLGFFCTIVPLRMAVLSLLCSHAAGPSPPPQDCPHVLLTTWCWGLLCQGHGSGLPSPTCCCDCHLRRKYRGSEGHTAGESRGVIEPGSADPAGPMEWGPISGGKRALDTLPDQLVLAGNC